MSDLPVIDIAPLLTGATNPNPVAAEIGAACREYGFFYVVGHGVDEDLQARLENHSREFFAQDVDTKLRIGMARGGRAWRGYFPPEGELTSGVPDLKEGLYFGAELPAGDPRPLHGPNLFPEHPAGLRDAVLAYLDAMTALGHTLMSGIALSLGLDGSYFADRYTAGPLILFRVFNYPVTPRPTPGWGVGEHTDYGLLTILRQDDVGGLQVRSRDGWFDAVPIPGSFVCNLGDMLDRLTGGRYRSTPHRVLPSGTRDRLSWPFFFDPAFDADVRPVGLGELAAPSEPTDDRDRRWDRASVHDFTGTYGEYLLGKVGKVFPELGEDVLRQ